MSTNKSGEEIEQIIRERYKDAVRRYKPKQDEALDAKQSAFYEGVREAGWSLGLPVGKIEQELENE